MDSNLKGYKPDSARWPVLRNGVIFFKGNRSRGGAGLVLQNDVVLPLVFDLEIDGENMRRRCVAIWRDQCRIGVSFDIDRITHAVQDGGPVEVQAAREPASTEKEQSPEHLPSIMRFAALTNAYKTAVMTSTEAAAHRPEHPDLANRHKGSRG